MKALRRARHRWLRLRRVDPGGESGFGLMELVVASTVMMTALTSMAYVTTSAFGDIAMAKERQSANALLDEAIEQLRALPYDTVSLGMRTSDLAGDPRVIGSGTSGAPYRLASTNERIVHVSTNQIIAPLVPNVSSRTIDNKVYAVRVYLTHFQDNPGTGAVTATAYVDWTSSARNAGSPAFLRASTVIFSPAAAAAGDAGACLSTATHPFSGPCLAFFFGAASADAGEITATGSGVLSTVFGGTTRIGLPGASSTMQLEQTTSVQGRAINGGVAVGTSSQGFQATSSKADNDPASPGSMGHDAQTGAALTVSAVTTSGGTSATFSGSGNAATSVSTTAASDAQACQNVAGTANVTDGLPCGRSSAHISSLNSNLALGTLDITGQTIGGLPPVSITNARSTAHTDRQSTSASGACAGTSSTGCIRSTATRTIQALAIGGMPNGEYLLKLDNFTATAVAEAGINAAAPTATASTATGLVKIWNPLLGAAGAYQDVAVAFGSGATIPTPTVTFNDLINPGLVLTITGELRTGTATTSSAAGTCMVSLACRTRADATLTAPISGVITYRFQLGSNIVTMTHTIQLGNLTASASYADPPSTA